MCYNIKKFKGEVKFMRLSITHTKNNTYFYMIKSYRENGKNKTKAVKGIYTGPEEQKRSSLMSSQLRSTSNSPASGKTATEAAEVCILPCDSVSGTL